MMLSLFDAVPERDRWMDRQTDRRTDRIPILISRVTIAVLTRDN